MDIQVTTAARKQKRDIKNRLNRNIIKHLAEIILNADDSYKRLETINQSVVDGKITIKVNSLKRVITIIDHAEGMSDSQLKDIFGTYGADKNQRAKVSSVRGLFGQGASDVMFASAIDHKKAYIKSIKDDKIGHCQFFIDPTTQVQTIRVETIQLSNNRLQNLRKSIDIPANGTYVEFELPEDVKIPKRHELEKIIKEYPYFRYLLSNPRRSINLIYDAQLSSLSVDISQDAHTLLTHHEGHFIFENHTIQFDLKLYHHHNSITDGIRILVEDEHHVVYDNRFFGYEKHLGASFLHGVLVIYGFSEFLSENLNSENPREIITSTRDGFKTDDDFYLTLADVIDPVLKKTFKDFEKTYSQKDIDITSNKNVTKALREMNKTLSELQSDVIPGTNQEPPLPSQGLLFARQSISISIDKSYVLPLYINTELIPVGSIISIVPSSTQRFTLTSRTLLINELDVRPSGLAIKTINLKASESTTLIPEFVTATCRLFSAQTMISIVDKNIHYPPNGIDFYPNLTSFVPNSLHKLHLYIDLNKIPIGSVVALRTDQQDKLKFELNDLIIQKHHIMSDEIALIDIQFDGGFIGDRFKVTAECLLFECSAFFTIVENQTPSSLTKGLFNQIKLQRSDNLLWQSQVQDGTILINLANPIAKKNMKDIDKLTPEDTIFAEDDLPYIYEMIASEASKLRCQQDNISINDINHLIERYEEKKSEYFAKITKQKQK